MRSRRTAVCLAATVAVMLLAAGCSERPRLTPTQEANTKACGGTDCHSEQVASAERGTHSALDCVECHKGTGKAHAADPKTAKASIDWTIEGCGGCHEPEATTYLYDDNRQVGPFGGSVREPAQPKVDTFPEYNTIVSGHGFTREYNEEGAHAFMLRDHYDIKRGKFETCVQCKSTKVAYYWNTGTPLEVDRDQTITLTHTATDTEPAKKVTVPKGTTITYKTDLTDRTVTAVAKLPDGTVYSSPPQPSADATLSYNMTWAVTIAATDDVMPYGQGCNHCHDPHTGGPRVVRKAMIETLSGKDTKARSAGVNPYREGSPTSFDAASTQDQQVLQCAQCHVEYTCGKSGVDGKNRDSFGWSKASDLHEFYSARYNYAQDWRHTLIGEPLIKSQHSETELYWNSIHYDTGASCSDCHMPFVRDAGGRTFRSHWMTSPYKYSDAETLAAFEEATDVTGFTTTNPCASCHYDRTARSIAQQRDVFERQKVVEKLLVDSINGLTAMRQSGDTSATPAFKDALDAHRRAHVLWENLIVSENSMGFHNYEEVLKGMDDAEENVRKAIEIESSALKN